MPKTASKTQRHSASLAITPTEEESARLAAEREEQEPVAAIGGAELAGAQLSRDEIGATATGDRYARHGDSVLAGDEGKAGVREPSDDDDDESDEGDSDLTVDAIKAEIDAAPEGEDREDVKARYREAELAREAQRQGVLDATEPAAAK